MIGFLGWSLLEKSKIFKFSGVMSKTIVSELGEIVQNETDKVALTNDMMSWQSSFR